MNISNWGVGRIMQLPDWCFGRRFTVCTAHAFLGAGTDWQISRMAFPERMVIWEVFVQATIVPTNVATWRMAFHDQLPISEAQFSQLDPVLPGMVTGLGTAGSLTANASFHVHLANLRQYRETGGRRLVSECTASIAQKANHNIFVTCSPVPTDIPDWLVRGRGHQEEKW